MGSVSVNGEVISSIGKGLCVLVGIHRDDTPKQRETLVRKVLNMRLFSDEAADGYQGAAGTLSVKDLSLPVLCVSQFTLYGQMKGNKPDFRLAMTGDQAREYYDSAKRTEPGGHHEVLMHTTYPQQAFFTRLFR